jgi:RNA polymerase sigma factor (sigma-70 family)
MESRGETTENSAETRSRMLEELLGNHQTQLRNQVRFHSRSPEEAEEALADACVQFMRFWDGPPGIPALQWMLVVAKRCAWAIAGRERRRAAASAGLVYELGDSQLERQLPDPAPDPAERAERSAELAEIAELLEELKPDERTALILLGLGCSYAEIAELRGWSYTKVNRCIAEGRDWVRARLAEGER